MSNWDDGDWDAPAAAAPKAALPSHGVAASWEDEDVSDGEDATVAAAAPKASAPMKPAKARALAIKKREQEEMARAKAKRDAREAELEAMSAIERKMEQQRLVEEGDMEHTADLFGKEAVAAGKEFGDVKQTIDNFTPTTENEFSKFAEMVGEKCRKLNTNPRRTTQYVNLVKDIMRQLTADLGADDVKDLSTHMGLLSNEKREAFKKSKGHKKKAASKKSHVKVDRAMDDMGNGRYDDFDDDAFM